MTAEQTGTGIVIKTVCTNSSCRKEFVWSSQPFMPGTKILAGNFLILMAVLFAGGSFTKVRQIFLHMGLACISLSTFFRHQRVSDDYEREKKLILCKVGKCSSHLATTCFYFFPVCFFKDFLAMKEIFHKCWFCFLRYVQG